MAKTYNYFHESDNKPKFKNNEFIRFNVRSVAMVIDGDKKAEDAFETILARLQELEEINKINEFKLSKAKETVKYWVDEYLLR